jgi:hypothetical protein
VGRDIGNVSGATGLEALAERRYDLLAEQLDLLGEVVATLRVEMEKDRPADVPDAPTHDSLVAAKESAA